MPIRLRDGDDHATVLIDDTNSVARPTRRRRTKPPEQPVPALIDLTQEQELNLEDDDYMSDNTLARNFSRLFPSANLKETRTSPPVPPAIVSGLVTHTLVEDWIEFNYEAEPGIGKKIKLCKGKAVELHTGEFLRIGSIITHISSSMKTMRAIATFLTGALFERTRNLNAALHFKANEVAMVESNIKVNLSDVKRPRQLILTNAPFPNFRDCEGGNESRLVCRWVWDFRTYEGKIRRIAEHEADEKYRWKDSWLRYGWREKYIIREDKKHQAEQNVNYGKLLMDKHAGYTMGLAISPMAVIQRTGNQARRGGFPANAMENDIKRVKQINVFTESCLDSAPKNLVNRMEITRPHKNYEHRTSTRSSSLPLLDNALHRGIDGPVKPSKSQFSDDVIMILEKPRVMRTREPAIESLDNGSRSSSSNRHGTKLLPTNERRPIATPEPDMAKSAPRSHSKVSPSRKLPWINLAPGESLFPTQDKKYTYGDAFCGGGGATCGARMAGFDIKFGFDKDEAAIRTWRANFPEGTAYHTTADVFVLLQDDTIVDVMHISPPCQPFSPAHTIPGQHDDENRAALFCIDSILKKCKPRFATLEQTYGILHYREFFLGILNMFTEHGYSVAYRILKGVEFGLPQDRKRLFIIAASPGEILPPWPKATHSYLPGPSPDLQRFVSLNEALDAIPVDATDHEPKPFPHPRAVPYNPNLYLTRTIMAGGGDYDVHPSGKRPFTLRELSSIQGFPLSYNFSGIGGEKKRQVGNAVPPILGAAIFMEIRKKMEEMDCRREFNQEGKCTSAEEAVLISDEEDSDEVQIVRN